MINTVKIIFIAFSLIFVSSIGHADSSVESLSPELRALLGKEMRALEEGMQSIITAYVSGNLEKVSNIAEKMKNSFILKQEITNGQKHELVNKISRSFLRLDKKFHEYAGMLQHVAKEKHIELVGFYYYKLTEACVVCHSNFASHRFPKLKFDATKEGHNH
ncbi:hypothetical protein Noc_1069 [Nitrosococcus oceani ATCC 19707]|uniref:Cytochrome c n=2 Tax=Nitrosococcus oceani TaxID=1229 RepID=Q3JC69_NITOC|nr:hypothetical protein [Nitrosococcus oceani]ABA57577.1 hypothetical protein Noc_1069 [Nitrosococcus oceani ATCC 19707]EDZ67227.1 hypothetical protein NOC27_554 [Nitrosococcus oceani AFC27]KFI20078.1 hypothetical protein IB75_05495 [Nitrosococcus oceani C-27]GEM20632.1 hypothetical protein NONS58_20510 [Nitrosococcus oceani]